MKFTSTIIAALVAAALTGQATAVKLNAEVNAEGHNVTGADGKTVPYHELYNKLMRQWLSLPTI